MRREITFESGSAAGNANVDFTVPSNKQWELLYAHVILTTDATAANRYMETSVLDTASTEVIDIHSGVAVPASQTNQHHSLMQGVYRETSFINNTVQVPIPMDLVASEGWTFRFSVANGVAGDSHSVTAVFEEHQ